eukprot:288687-Alexandrium_andersonii.AAC.1
MYRPGWLGVRYIGDSARDMCVERQSTQPMFAHVSGEMRGANPSHTFRPRHHKKTTIRRQSGAAAGEGGTTDQRNGEVQEWRSAMKMPPKEAPTQPDRKDAKCHGRRALVTAGAASLEVATSRHGLHRRRAGATLPPPRRRSGRPFSRAGDPR